MSAPATPHVAIACLRADPERAYPRHSVCLRELGHNEFAFLDAEHAMKFYADVRQGLKVCPECAEAYRLSNGWDT